MPSQKFSVMWSNNDDYTRGMSSFRVTLRDPTGACPTREAHGGITCDELHLDQVHIQFRPTTDIDADEFQHGDSDKLTWRAETMELYVGLTPGVRYTLYTQGAQNLDIDKSDGTVVQPGRSLQYSCALALAPYVGGEGENYWCRTYRPLRDIPVAYDLHMVAELRIELLWPFLQGDDRVVSWKVPDYRISRVICDFSLRSESYEKDSH